MTLRQYLIHLWWWLRMFPPPSHDEHVMVGVVGDRALECMVCHAEGVDDDLTEEDLERDKQMSAEWDQLSKKYHGDTDSDTE